MKRSDFTGTGKVFAFTLRQLVCNKANLISLAVTAVVMLLMFPAMTLFGGASSTATVPGEVQDEMPTLPTKIYLSDETKLLPDFQTGLYADIPVVTGAFPSHLYKTSVKLEENEAWIHTYVGDEGYVVEVYATPEASSSLEDHAVAQLDAARFAQVDGVDVLTAPFQINTISLGEFESTDEDDGMGAYFVQLFYSILVMLVSMYAAAYIVQSVGEEKTSRLVETLMISVRPLALILGKILAVMVYVFGMIALFGLCGVFSNLINRNILSGNSPIALFSSMGIPLAELNVNPATVAVAVFSLLLGFLTYALLSGMTGAGCSEPEDMQAANSTSIMIVMGCYMISLFTSMAGSEAVYIVTSLLPMVSVFCAPVQFMMGNIGIGVLIVAWILQFAVIGLLAAMCAKIYEELIIYRGKRMTFMEIIRLAMRKGKCQ